jgi:hypothetical protein
MTRQALSIARYRNAALRPVLSAFKHVTLFDRYNIYGEASANPNKTPNDEQQPVLKIY